MVPATIIADVNDTGPRVMCSFWDPRCGYGRVLLGYFSAN